MRLTILVAKADCKMLLGGKRVGTLPTACRLVFYFNVSKHWSHKRLLNAYLIDIPHPLGDTPIHITHKSADIVRQKLSLELPEVAVPKMFPIHVHM